jgi:predicted O-methyltransferase YrrM
MNVWMSIDERNLVSKYLGYNKTMLEWGAGGSTLFFSKFVKKYISIEHDEGWYNEVKAKIGDNVELHHVLNNEPRTIPTDPKQFEDYINYVDTLNQKYDIVLVDGRARPECAKKVIPYLKENAIVIMHDFWERPAYHWVLDYYEEIESIKKGQTIVILRKK